MARLDKFYTKRAVAKMCVDILDLDRYDVLLEPGAGAGAFFDLLPAAQREGYDLEPAHPGGEIKTLDFFDYQADPTKTYLAVGNPPFGKNSSSPSGFLLTQPVLPRQLLLCCLARFVNQPLLTNFLATFTK